MPLLDSYRNAPIAILGAGTIGMSWAALYAARGHDVAVWDPRPGFGADLARYVETALASLAKLEQAVEKPGAVRAVESPEAAVKGALFVQENAPERLEAKQELLHRIAPHLDPHAIVASSTSSIPPSLIQKGVPFAERFLIGHPFNPPHLIPLVELVAGGETDPATVDAAHLFYTELGRKPIRLKREALGHLANRLQAALWREAVHAVTSGLASLEDVDTCIAYGPGLRWALMGQHMIFHLAGGPGGYGHFIDHLGPAFENQWNDLQQPPLDEATRSLLTAEMEQAVGERNSAELAAERDRLLVELIGALNRARATA